MHIKCNTLFNLYLDTNSTLLKFIKKIVNQKAVKVNYIYQLQNMFTETQFFTYFKNICSKIAFKRKQKTWILKGKQKKSWIHYSCLSSLGNQWVTSLWAWTSSQHSKTLGIFLNSVHLLSVMIPKIVAWRLKWKKFKVCNLLDGDGL